MITTTDVTTQDRSGQVAFTPEEIAVAQVKLVEIAQARRKALADEIRDGQREISNIDDALRFSMLGQDEAQQIAVRCEVCGTVFLKFRNVTDTASALCTKCRYPVWLHPDIEDRLPVAFPPAQADPSTADETVPSSGTWERAVG